MEKVETHPWEEKVDCLPWVWEVVSTLNLQCAPCHFFSGRCPLYHVNYEPDQAFLRPSIDSESFTSLLFSFLLVVILCTNIPGISEFYFKRFFSSIEKEHFHIHFAWLPQKLS